MCRRAETWTLPTLTSNACVLLSCVARTLQLTLLSSRVWQTYYTTEEALPALIRRSEVIQTRTVEITGLENAIHDVQIKTQELDVRQTLQPEQTSLTGVTDL